MKTTFEPYEGAEPYIFVSYARKDSKQVTPLLDALNLAGYRVWYDKGIQSGKRWADSLAEHIMKCAVFMPLISSAFADSTYCYDETSYARAKDREIIPVYLEDGVELPPGLDMALHPIQWRRLSDYRKPMDFAVSFEREPAFAPCKNLIEWHNSGGIRWAIRDGGELTIIQRTADSMPDYSKENAAPWKERSEEITSAVIASGVTRMGSYAFYQCANLRGVTIPDSVTEIGQAAFEDCASLASIVVPGNVRKISDWMCYQCSSLENVVLLNGVTEIGRDAFSKCSNLSKITIPDSVISIGIGAFYHCFNLSGITIPNKVTEIKEWTFRTCKSLTNITIPDSVTTIKTQAFYNCACLSDITISNKVIEISPWTFRGCKSLTNVVIPDGVTKILDHAFCVCDNLENVTIPDSVRKIGDYAFGWCPKLSKVSVPNRTGIDEHAFDSTTEVIRR